MALTLDPALVAARARGMREGGTSRRHETTGEVDLFAMSLVAR